MANPAWVEDVLRSSAGTYRPGPGVSPQGGSSGDDDVEGYIRRAASQRGIDPEVAIRVAQSEGGLVPNRTGAFPTGKSFWPFQLHYGGAGTPYEKFGTVAGMGNTFTAQTGWQPGDPNAWRAATDYALDQAKRQGWAPYHGPRNQGITGYQGIGTAPLGAKPAAAPAAPAANAPPWVRDLLDRGEAGTPTDLVDRGPRVTNPQQAGIDAMRRAEQTDGSAPAWVRDLLATGAVVGAGAGPGYQGPAQTDEIWPVAGQKWGAVNNPFGAGQARAAGTSVPLPGRNVGADLSAPYGAPVVAPVSGTVVETFDAPDERDRNANHGWGGMTLLRGDNGYYYRLSHAQPGSIATRPGQRVAQGQRLQNVGLSGNTTGAHLDAEKFARPGEFVDIAASRGGSVAPAPRGVAAPGGPMPAWVRDLLGR